ncbi:MAG: tRNA (N6-isopentenyl adenosine(37)-C2)-methylthiotransferase MiaB [Bacillota bacterium]|nr:tRNA (N6-isopentenyl adenosine(37)-C2)-methylthiotransferase MiaB [Bacillota bacterium]MDD3298753.1 tRNA (N6-isopentenyl adenosine(37)-C2)-methylthiotransferase MiaB [Bacillota bacterium]MDD3851860.1 tRNA (N6-isopentenyl adenosine(37)-C2)-methylthiotransferase MiaB [Bacillota bacterium]MDD4707849.1 tRNA (N6-isopentenyl adenosine(37)-C2)-methylthiotransferase MiaB [Bacillota bacterium]
MGEIIKNKKYMIKTWGCQMNVHDSEKIAGVLSSLGYQAVDSEKQADLIIFNTCCVREHAELKVYGNLGRLKKLKEQRKDLMIAVCGCMTQQEEVARHIARRYPFVDIVFGTDKIHKLAGFIANAKLTGSTIIDIEEDEEGSIIEDVPVEREEGIKAWVAVMHGCNNYCSYCIVPYVRGRERSRKKEYILEEVKRLGQSGYKEVTLLGQNVNSYGKGSSDRVDFAALLRKVNGVDGIERIRFMTSHPKDLSDELIYAIRDCDKVCEHIHLPFQAGSNSILHRMNRKYTKEQYLELTDRIREEIPDISITTDIIVGFPGESEEDFLHTLDVVERVRFDSAFTFLYSKRSGTPAERMEGHISDSVKHERLKRLLYLTERITAENNSTLRGEVLEVLVEGVSKTHSGRLTGRTRTNKIVHFEGHDSLTGKLVNVRITDPQSWSLFGEALNE